MSDLPVNAISIAANKLRMLLLSEISDLSTISQISIGQPKGTFEDEVDKNQLNLFFYNVSYEGYPADGLNEDPFYVKLYCLITAVGAKGVAGSPSAGENDLRLIGEVMRVLHQQPVISVDNGNNVEIAQLQIVPHKLNLDNLNHIWSTQGNKPYRLSVAYEMALAPIPLAVAVERSPLLGEPQIVVWGAMKRSPEKELDGLVSQKPLVKYLEIDTDRKDWKPHICLFKNIQPSRESEKLHYVFKVEADFDGNFDGEMKILIAGKNNGKVKLVWNIWRRKENDTVVPWKEDIPDSVGPVEKEIINKQGPTVPFFPNRIDPSDIDLQRIFNVKLPGDILGSDKGKWQAVLHAIHEWKHKDPANKDVTTLIKSNSILLYGDKS